MARHRSPRGHQGQTGLIRLDAPIPQPRTAESSATDLPAMVPTGSLPRPREEEPWADDVVDLDEDDAVSRELSSPAGADEPEPESAPRAAHRRRRRARSKRLRRGPVGALTVLLVAAVVAGLIVGATALLGARKPNLANPDQGTNLAQGVPAAPPPAPAAPPERAAPPAPAQPPAAAPVPEQTQPKPQDAKPRAEAAPKTQSGTGGASSNGPKTSVPARGAEKQLKIWLTGYSFQDNTPPGSSTVSMPIVHRKAGGTGTYADPITVAVPGHGSNGSEAWKGGTRFYLPTVQRYVIVEDSGASEAPSGQDGHLDMWVDGEGGSKSASDSCMDKITGTGVPAIMNPAPGKPVMAGPITANGRCNLPGGASSSSSKSDDD